MLGAQDTLALLKHFAENAFLFAVLTLIVKDIGDSELHPSPLHSIAGPIAEILRLAQPF
jgi:hypothetical protein